MEAINFAIKDGVYLSVNGEFYDLHNDYDFEGYSLDGVTGPAALNWKRGSDSWVNPNQPKKIILNVREIEKFKIEEGRPLASELDQKTLDEIAYLTEADWCDGPFTIPGLPEPGWDWVFIFESDLWITINAKSATVEISPNNLFKSDQSMSPCLLLSQKPRRHTLTPY